MMAVGVRMERVYRTAGGGPLAEEAAVFRSLLGVLRMSRLRRLEEITSATNLVQSEQTSRRLQP